MALLDRIRTQHQRMTAPKPKAITEHRPDLSDRVHMSSSNSGTWAEPIQDSFVDYANVYGVYVWVRKATDKIAQNISTLPIEVLDKDGTAIPEHELAVLLGKGNDAMPAPVLWENWVSSMMLSGEGPIEIVPDRRGRPSELWPRRSDLVLVQPDVSPERRNYPAVAGYVVMPDGAQVDTLYLAPDAMIFDKFYNPLSPWRGLSPISAIRNSITIDLFAQSWSKAFLKGGARPDYAVMAPQGLTKTERDNIQAEMMYQFGGAQNAGKPIVLESGATDIKPFSWAPKDIEWLSQREFSRDEVAALFGVPDEIMGFGRDTFENFSTAFEVFWKLTLRPLITHRDMVLTHFFTMRRPILLPGQRIATDLTSVGVLHDDKTGSVDQASKLWAVGVPFNQLDEQLGLGIGPVPGGEYPFGKEPVVFQIDQVAPNNDMRLLPEGVSAGKGFFTSPQTRTTFRHLTYRDMTPMRKMLGDMTGQITRDAWLTLKALTLRTIPGDDDAEEAIYVALEERAQAALTRAFREQWRNLLPENAESMELYELQAYINERLISTSVNDAIARAVQDAVDVGLNIALDQLGTAGLGFDYALVNVRARDWAQRHVGQMISDFGNTTQQAVQQAVSRWYENGEPLSALRRDLEPAFGERRAQMIAMTETTSAAAQGSFAGYDAAGVSEVMWRNVNDSKVCPICLHLDKKTITMGESFYDLLTPELQKMVGNRPFKLPPGHVNCRCRISPMIPKVT